MNKLVVVSISLLFVVSPFMEFWIGSYSNGEYSYSIHLFPLFFVSETKNNLGYQNYTSIEPINNMKKSDLKTINNLTLKNSLLIVGWLYLIISLTMFIILIDGAMVGSLRTMDLSVAILFGMYIIYMLYLVLFLNNSIGGVYGNSIYSPIHGSFGIGSIVPIFGVVSYVISRYTKL